MNNYINLVYDFTRRPYDVDWWSTLSGAPTVVGTNLVVNGEAVMSAEFSKGNLEIEATITEAPAAGQVKKIGWLAPGQGAYAYFEVSGTTFRAATSDGEGNSQTSDITWDSTWESAATKFQIRWDASGFTFLVDGVRKAKISEILKHPRVPLSPYVKSTGGASVTVSYVSVLGAQEMFHIESVASDYVPLDAGYLGDISDSITISESVTIANTELGGSSVSDTLTLTEDVTIARLYHEVDGAVDTLTITEDVAIAVA